MAPLSPPGRASRQELTAWAGVLKRTGGDPAKLRAEALELAGSDQPNERLIALSLVWPSDAHLASRVGRYRHAKVMTDKARIAGSPPRPARRRCARSVATCHPPPLTRETVHRIPPARA